MSGFFRDPEAFRALAGLVPSLFEGKGPDEAVRVWVAGCAGGEEAFSIAILLSEHAATLECPLPMQVFATDVDERGCARGRAALYFASAAAGLPPARLGRSFVHEAGGYRVARHLREGVLFAVHDVLRDPPFAGLDLVSCRNLLSGLPNEARVRVLATFHDALRPGGVLFLGPDETAGDGARWVPAAGAQHIYRRAAGTRRAPRTAAAARAGSTAFEGNGSRT